MRLQVGSFHNVYFNSVGQSFCPQFPSFFKFKQQLPVKHPVLYYKSIVCFAVFINFVL